MNRNKFGLILIVVIVVLLFGDEAWISWRFHQLCKDAGVHVYQKVEAEGYLNDTHRATTNFAYETLFRDPKMIANFEKDGFRFRRVFYAARATAP